MKSKIWLLAIIAFGLACGALGQAAQKPSFDGAWTMDRARSFGMPADMQQSMTVKQDGDRIELETKIITAKGETSINDSYLIDGQEHDFIPQGNSGPIPNSKGKRKANWLPNGKGIMVEEVSTVETEKGSVTNHLTRKWIISGDGELTIDLYYDVPAGSFETKRIFIRTNQ
ncbi:MAG TPA: hypothetical protein VMM84_16370 [Pyrinomonadaceae bacterium]|nr:hypothetical protein [Pyrinomonadaceae bacterium]